MRKQPVLIGDCVTHRQNPNFMGEVIHIDWDRRKAWVYVGGTRPDRVYKYDILERVK